jgi:hypothetical protein
MVPHTAALVARHMAGVTVDLAVLHAVAPTTTGLAPPPDLVLSAKSASR